MLGVFWEEWDENKRGGERDEVRIGERWMIVAIEMELESGAVEVGRAPNFWL